MAHVDCTVEKPICDKFEVRLRLVFGPEVTCVCPHLVDRTQALEPFRLGCGSADSRSEMHYGANGSQRLRTKCTLLVVQPSCTACVVKQLCAQIAIYAPFLMARMSWVVSKFARSVIARDRASCAASGTRRLLLCVSWKHSHVDLHI